MKIGLISDTHGFLDEQIFHHFENCDEIWHAGDFGDVELVNRLMQFKPLRGVYGNIDGQNIRSQFKENETFQCELVKVFMTHIGGYPPRYNSRVLSLLRQEKPQLFISGHSHILKIMYDEKIQCLHMNPGAAGRQGWHKVRTLIRFQIDGNNMHKAEVIELGPRSVQV
jgi:putative phosphoesterase